MAMEALRASWTPAMTQKWRQTIPNGKPMLNYTFNPIPNSPYPLINTTPMSKTKLFSTISSTISTEEKKPVDPFLESADPDEKFDWFSQWYPIMPVCDLDKKKPHAKKVMGLDVVVWFDRNENAWKVFGDSCPHRLAPLSEGRIDQWGRLQCVYHGWCFSGSGDCKFIPQAPPDGPPVATFSKACAAVYPSTVQHEIVWFWPNTNPLYKDILLEKRPPFIPELDDPSFTKIMTNRDIPYGYELLIENLMDPAHVPYAHYGIMHAPTPKDKADREGGTPIDIKLQKVDKDGFDGKFAYGNNRFIAPCVYTSSLNGDGIVPTAISETEAPSELQKRVVMVFICIPVSPGKSRLIWTFPRNFAIWLDRIVPRWVFHVGGNLIIDSDLYLLHVEERKLMEAGQSNWQKTCFLPTKSDANVITFRKWLNKYSSGQVNFGTKFSGAAALPPSPPRDQLMDRYWSHVVNCSSCKAAYKGLNVLETVLKVIPIALIGIVAATKQSTMSAFARTGLVSMAVLCVAASRFLASFNYKTFHFHDYNHAVQ